MSHVVSDWIIELVPADSRYPYPETGHLNVIRGERTDAIEMVELYASGISRRGTVPRSGDWQNESPASIVRRVGPATFVVRVDCFEFETDSGYSG